ncbi:CheY chemotaxis protein or a CheY-like REC (receiver) domain [Dyadobacter soli]|uniref:CheY chemotaxis protein or a CheY-like REC (Receiver) domain n=1 Tax=Dyadobacter soli TaxID=659014 RepID=A0A1G7D0R3_9BACT|nr:response regulator [Dyadobacter soli]SDE45111.1 CheY chemotaxis protein or a CheY-like REC (receiver) domain [Dyadobacter soli]
MSKREIYLVEDSSDFRQLVRGIFTKFLPEYHVRFFQGAQELYQYMVLQSAEQFKGRRPGLIILDLQLNAISGLELLKLVRQTPGNTETEWKNIPIVILSGTSRQEDINRCYQAGANSFFVKPTEFEELHTLLETLCRYWIDYNRLASADIPDPIIAK